MEQQQIQEKHQLLKHQLKEAFFMHRHQMHMKHKKVSLVVNKIVLMCLAIGSGATSKSRYTQDGGVKTKTHIRRPAAPQTTETGI